MQDIANMFWEYKWIVLAVIAAIAVFVALSTRKLRPLMDVAKEHKRMEELYSNLSVQKLEHLDDDTIVKAVMFNVWSQMADDMSDEFKVVERQEHHRKTVYIVTRLTDDLRTGGFEQIYLTASRKFGRICPTAFEEIGAHKYAEIMGASYKVYFDNREIFDKGERLGQDDAYLFDSLEQSLSEADKTENIDKLCAQYIRDHINEICE